jgi:hypothetical protein
LELVSITEQASWHLPAIVRDDLAGRRDREPCGLPSWVVNRDGADLCDLGHTIGIDLLEDGRRPRKNLRKRPIASIH